MTPVCMIANAMAAIMIIGQTIRTIFLFFGFSSQSFIFLL